MTTGHQSFNFSRTKYQVPTKWPCSLVLDLIASAGPHTGTPRTKRTFLPRHTGTGANGVRGVSAYVFHVLLHLRLSTQHRHKAGPQPAKGLSDGQEEHIGRFQVKLNIVPLLLRFGMWDDILGEPQKEDSNLYATAVASGHYARGLAFAAKGLIEQAEEEQVHVHTACIGSQGRNFLIEIPSSPEVVTEND